MIKIKKLSRCPAIQDNPFLCPIPLLYIVCFENRRLALEYSLLKLKIKNEKARKSLDDYEKAPMWLINFIEDSTKEIKEIEEDLK